MIPQPASRSPRRRRPTTLTGPLLALLLVAPSASATPAADVGAVRLPDGGVHADAAVDARGRIHLVYFKGEPAAGDAYYVRSDDGGATFSPPLRVNSRPRSAMVIGTVRGPHLALGRGGRVHVAWMGSAEASPTAAKRAPLLYTRLNDAGDGFEAQRDGSGPRPGLDGGGSVAADADGNVYLAWHAPGHPAAGKPGAADGDETGGEAGRRVWVARSADDGATFAPPAAVDPGTAGVCACCGLRAFAGPGGAAYVLYRSAAGGVDRDVQLLASGDRGRTFAIVTSDPWKVAACVMSTAAFAGGPAGRPGAAAGTWAAWETQGRIRLGHLAGGATAAAPAPVMPADVPGTGKNRKHPAVAVNRDGEVLVAWTEGTSWAKGGSVAWQAFDRGGHPIAGRAGRADGLSAWGRPAAVALPDDSFRIVY